MTQLPPEGCNWNVVRIVDPNDKVHFIHKKDLIYWDNIPIASLTYGLVPNPIWKLYKHNTKAIELAFAEVSEIKPTAKRFVKQSRRDWATIIDKYVEEYEFFDYDEIYKEIYLSSEVEIEDPEEVYAYIRRRKNRLFKYFPVLKSNNDISAEDIVRFFNNPHLVDTIKPYKDEIIEALGSYYTQQEIGL